MAFDVAVFRKSSGILTKKIRIIDGKVEKDASGCQMGRGYYTPRRLDTLQDLQKLIQSLDTDQAIGHGFIPGAVVDEEIRIVSASRMEDLGGARGEIHRKGGDLYACRTKQFFKYREGQALILLDYDPDPGAPTEQRISTPEQLINHLAEVHPIFKSVGYLRTYSTSSSIHDKITGERLIPPEGMHIYMVVEQGRDIERFAEALQNRLWLAKLGWIKVSKGGALLRRTIIDAAVFSPERLDFVAGAYISSKESLEQRRPEPEIKEGGTLDTSLIASLTELEKGALSALITEAERDTGVRKKYKAAIVEAAQVEVEKGVPEREAIQTVLSRKRGRLNGADVVEFENGQRVTVSDLVSNAVSFNGMKCYDPIRPEKGVKAKFYANVDSGPPAIHSFVGGQTVYKLGRPKQNPGADSWVSACHVVTVDRCYLGNIPIGAGATLVESAKNTGKTETFRRYCNSNPDKSVLILTHRQSLAWAISNRLNAGLESDDQGRFLCYLDKEGGHIGTARRLVISLDSLHKVGNSRFDVVIFDECEQGIRHFTSQTMKNRYSNISTFRRIIKQAVAVVCADADMSSLTHDEMVGIRGESCSLIRNLYQTAAGRHITLVPAEGMTDAILEGAKRGSCYVAVNGRTIALDIRTALISELAGENVADAVRGADLITVLPDGRRVICVTSDNSNTEEAHKFIREINHQLEERDILICSPSVGTGVSIERHFDNIFFRFSSRAGNTPADCSQQLFRVREWTHAVGSIVSVKHRLPTNPDAIKNKEIFSILGKAGEALGEILNYNSDGFYTTRDGRYCDLFGRVRAMENAARNDFRKVLVKHLKDEGYTVENGEVALIGGKELMKAVCDARTEYEQDLLETAELLPAWKYEQTRCKVSVTRSEKFNLQKTRIGRLFGFNQDDEHLREFLRLSIPERDALERLLPLAADPLVLEIRDREALKNKAVGWTTRKYFSQHRKAVVDLLAVCGVRWCGKTFVHNTGLLDMPVLYSHICSNTEILEDMGCAVKTNAKGPSGVAKAVVTVLHGLGLMTKQQRIQVNGKRVKRRGMDGESLERAAAVLTRSAVGSQHTMFVDEYGVGSGPDYGPLLYRASIGPVGAT